MSLSADQRAILELLLVRGADYETIASVLDADPNDARARAHGALAALAGDAVEIDAALADYMLGRATSAERERVAGRLAANPEANEVAHGLAERLRAEIGGAELAKIPPPPAPRPGRNLLLAWVAAIALVVAVVVVIATGALSGDESATTGPEDAASSEQESARAESVRIPLRAPRGGDASGVAVIGLRSDFRPYLDLHLENVDPAPEGSLHLLWVDVADGKGLPLPAAIPIARDGSFDDRFKLPVNLLAVVDAARNLDLVVVPASKLRALREELGSGEGKQAAGGVDALPDHPGGTVLSGPIPSTAAQASRP